MNQRDLMREVRSYCARLLNEGSRTWDAPDEFSEQDEERWRSAIRKIASQIGNAVSATRPMPRKSKRKSK